MGNYKELTVWQKSVDLITVIYSYTEPFPKEEIYSLTSQIRRSSISIPSHMAEGHSGRSRIDYIQFLKIARGSCAELETQLMISKNSDYLRVTEFNYLIQKSEGISKMHDALLPNCKYMLIPNA
ncbi:four helix bundle protein [Chryseobacterium sp. JJR-5R]|uniref:four helix bundle protein n=1 Tax=Chryseobacterium sp. JJR-5R TaxID=3093923 RepID=UPI002A761D48|nr:four helix bundle protein [Chryseobacterium sp. JJR-5R]WPO83184.1 four helix bundle protein [Chryseobacterium sp. JJR-5R]